MGIRIDIFNPTKTVNRIVKNDNVGIFTAETWGRYFSPYVPMQDGNLDQTRQTEPFKVIYPQPYAKRNYNGDNFKFSKEMHPLAQAHWDKPAFSANKNKVANEVTQFLKRM